MLRGGRGGVFPPAPSIRGRGWGTLSEAPGPKSRGPALCQPIPTQVCRCTLPHPHPDLAASQGDPAVTCHPTHEGPTFPRHKCQGKVVRVAPPALCSSVSLGNSSFLGALPLTASPCPELCPCPAPIPHPTAHQVLPLLWATSPYPSPPP